MYFGSADVPKSEVCAVPSAVPIFKRIALSTRLCYVVQLIANAAVIWPYTIESRHVLYSTSMSVQRNFTADEVAPSHEMTTFHDVVKPVKSSLLIGTHLLERVGSGTLRPSVCPSVCPCICLRIIKMILSNKTKMTGDYGNRIRYTLLPSSTLMWV